MEDDDNTLKPTKMSVNLCNLCGWLGILQGTNITIVNEDKHGNQSNDRNQVGWGFPAQTRPGPEMHV
jgi:hypothetical protein